MVLLFLSSRLSFDNRMSVRELGKKAVVFLELSEVLEISTEEIKV